MHSTDGSTQSSDYQHSLKGMRTAPNTLQLVFCVVLFVLGMPHRDHYFV